MVEIKYLWVVIFTMVLCWSGIDPKSQLTWFLEVTPAIVGALVLWITYKTFPLTPLVYILILIYSVILMIGGHYTFAEVPFFDGLTNVFGSDRNNYDKLSHFAQGVVPALIARELILRKNIVQGARWQQFFIVSLCLAFSAFYELIEWWGALLTGQDSETFLGTQGYVWDTQSDMGVALLGAIIGLISLCKLHDKQLRSLGSS